MGTQQVLEVIFPGPLEVKHCRSLLDCRATGTTLPDFVECLLIVYPVNTPGLQLAEQPGVGTVAKQGTTLQISADMRCRPSRQIEQALYQSKRQKTQADIQTALYASGVAHEQVPARLLQMRSRWV